MEKRVYLSILALLAVGVNSLEAQRKITYKPEIGVTLSSLAVGNDRVP